ncbi:MAG TPA: MFS transporter [Candidatus Kapabacteria bacterium]|nr:MFS transporter [Candidatus Kapabacteria bacterium]
MSAQHQHRVRTLWLSGVLHAFTHLYQVALLPLYLLILRDESFAIRTVEEATFLVTVLMLSYFIPAYPVGVLADRFSKRKLLALGLAVNAAGFVGLAFSKSYGQAIGCMIISGVGGSAFHPAATALIARLFPEATGKAFGLLGIGASAGFFLGPLYSGWRGAQAGWRTPMLELGILGMIIAIAFYFLADEEPEHAPRTSDHSSEQMFPTAALWIFFIAAAVAFSLRDFTGSSMGSLGSLFLQKAHGLSAEATGGILSMIFVASAISNPLFGKLSDRGVGRWTTLALTIAGIIVVSFPHFSPRMAPLVFAVYGFFFMASYPMVEGALMGSVPHHVRGRVFGLFITIGGILGNLAHWAMGAYVKNLGPASARVESYYTIYWMLAGFLALSLLGLPCLRALRNRETAEGALTPSMLPEKS